MALPSKLFKLKEWLTVPEAAGHLTIMFGEEVSEADVLRLALDGHLKISVNFVNGAIARRGKVITEEENFKLDWVEITMDGQTTKQSVDFYPFGKLFLKFNENVNSIFGVWDLPMLYNEQIEIYKAYHLQTNGPVVTLKGIKGVFVESPEDGCIWQLLESCDYNERPSSYPGLLRKLIELKSEEMLNQQRQDGEEDSKARKSKKHSSAFYPADGLPQDSVLVVRTSALTELIERTEKENVAATNGKSTVKNDIGTKERGTWLRIIYLLAMKIAKKNKTAFLSKGTLNAATFETEMKTIARELEMVSSLNAEDQPEQIKNITYGMSDDTLRKIFAEGEKIINKYFE